MLAPPRGFFCAHAPDRVPEIPVGPSPTRPKAPMPPLAINPSGPMDSLGGALALAIRLGKVGPSGFVFRSAEIRQEQPV